MIHVRKEFKYIKCQRKEHNVYKLAGWSVHVYNTHPEFVRANYGQNVHIIIEFLR